MSKLTLDPRPPIRQESRLGQNFPVCSMTLYPNSRALVNFNKVRRRKNFKAVVNFIVSAPDIFYKSFWLIKTE